MMAGAMECKCGQQAMPGKVTCGRVQCGSSTGNTASLSEMEAIARRAMSAGPTSPAEEAARADERTKWARILRQTAATKRGWAVELRTEAAEDDDREAASIHDREAVVWECIADVIECNNENPCVEDGAGVAPYEVKQITFRTEDLVAIDTSKCVVHGSGGPLMDIEHVETAADGRILVTCSWSGRRHIFDSAELRSLASFDPKPWLT
jgi:hypothetical protein